jgi:hypothetical protein
MSTSTIVKKYPGKSADEIFTKVDEAMRGLAARHGLDYRKDDGARAGSVSKMGAHGAYAVHEGQVSVELKFPMLVPGSMRKKVEEDIERKLEQLFA